MTHKLPTRILAIFFAASLLAACTSAGSSGEPTPTFTPRPTPWGPAAKIAVSLPANLPCRRSGNHCADWSFTVAFTAQNNIAAKVENIRMVFVSPENVVYASGGYPQWVSVDIPIPANGAGQYLGKAVNPKDPDLKGGRMDFFYQGYDEHGNKFSGKISTALSGY